MGTRSSKKSPWALVVAAAVIPFVASCAPQRHEVVTRQTTSIEERTVAAPKSIDISIVGLHDEPAVDPAQEKVVGTIVNEGDKEVSGLSIRVNALDQAGNVVRTIVTPPIAQTIAPSGGRATFEALMPRDAAVAGYHAVAIAR
ncbi:MAG: FxLYD domain-containing protein [Candidatus Binatia bacterium]